MMRPTETIADTFGISEDEARAVMREWLRLGLAKAGPHDGFRVVHGAVWDRDVVRRTLKSLEAPTDTVA